MLQVVVGALIRDGRVLLVHRRPDKRAHPDVWDLPGGVRERGESELGALTRELREELGVEIVAGSVSLLGRLPAGSADEPTVLAAWRVDDWDGVPENLAPEEHDGIGWFSLEQLPPPPHVLVRVALARSMTSDGS